MNSGSGIQELMAAETRASQIVAEARIGQFADLPWTVDRRMGEGTHQNSQPTAPGSHYAYVDFGESNRRNSPI